MLKKLFKILIQFYLKVLTKVMLWRKKPIIIAVAGSTNKTFVKEMILEELSNNQDSVRGNPRSFNTEIGLPLAVLFLPSGYSSIFRWVDILLTGTFISFFSRRFPKVLVLEMGVDKKGDMEYLLSMVKPRIAAVTNISKNFPAAGKSLDDIAGEVALLIKSLPADGLAVLNGDDERVKKMAESTKAKVIFYGSNGHCQARIEKITTTTVGQTFNLTINGKEERIETERFGVHNIKAIAIAKIIAEEFRKIKK